MLIGALFTSCASKKTLNQALSDLTKSEQSNRICADELDKARKHVAALQRDSSAAHKKIGLMAEDSVAKSKALHQIGLENKDLKSY